MDRYLTNRIENITDEDFWSSLRKLRELEPVRQSAAAGRRSQAYRQLGQWHAERLKPEVDAYHQQLEPLRDDAERLADRRRAADDVMQHRIRGWHNRVIQFGPRIDFNADFGQSGQYGFHYLSWLRPVLDVYAVTAETAYRDKFIDIIKQYYEQRNQVQRRIPRLHPVYYELGARAKAQLLLPAYAMLCDEPALDIDAREAMLKLLLGFARSLYRLQRDGFKAGNWQIVGSTMSYRIGAAMPEFREATQWRSRGLTRLEEHARYDFFADGGHGERCWGYGFMSLGSMVEFYRAALRYDMLDATEKRWWTRFFKRAFRWYAYSTTPNGYNLNFGDGSLNRADAIFALAEEVFPSLANEPGLLGVDRSRSGILTPSGYAFMRSGDEPEAPFMAINFGKWGGWHTHDDLLDFSLWAHGQPLIDEVGRFGSYDIPLNPMFRSAGSHNQIVLEHIPMDRRSHEAHDVRWHSDDAVDLFSGWHEAFAPARIHRHITFIKPDYWLVYDVVSAREYNFQASSWLHAPKPFKEHEQGWRTAGSPGCLVCVPESQELRTTRADVDYEAEEYIAGTGNDNPLARERHHLQLTHWRDIGDARPITFAMLLVPFAGRNTPKASIASVTCTGDESEQAAAFEVRINGRRDLHVVNPTAAAIRVNGRAMRSTMAVRRGRAWLAEL